MSTIVLQGTALDFTGASIAYVGPISLTITISDGATLSYAPIAGGATNLFGETEIQVTATAGVNFSLGQDVGDEAYIQQLNFANGSTATVLSIYDDSNRTDYVFVLDGAIAPPTNQGEVDALVNALDASNPTDPASGVFAPNTPIDPVSALAGVVSQDDQWQGTNLADTFDGGAGNDNLNGLGGNDFLLAGTGIDDLNGGEGNDTLTAEDVDTQAGDFFSGGNGTDTFQVSSTNNQIVNLNLEYDNSFIEVFDFNGWETILGTSADNRIYLTGVGSITNTGGANPQFDLLGGNDQFSGSEVGETVSGGAGNDNLHGLGGNDFLLAGTGIDNLGGGEGNDTLTAEDVDTQAGDFFSGGNGTDTFQVSTASNEIVSILLDVTASVEIFDFNTWTTVFGTDGNNSVNLSGVASYVTVGTANPQFDLLGGNDQFFGSEVGETVSGGAGGDTLFSQGGNDFLQGGIGVDDLNGGEGNDTLSGGEGDDSINGGEGIDTALYDLNRNAYSVTDLGGGEVQISSAVGTDIVSNVEFFAFADAQVSLTELLGGTTDPESDLTGDGTSDILWRNGTTGQYGMFDMAGGTPTWSVLGGESTAWQIGGLGDFDGDGTDDILWRNDTSGGIGFSAMGSGSPVWNALGTASAAWQIMGVGDFNGDGTDDILWQNSSNGGVGMFAMSGGAQTWQTIGGSSAPWEIVATGDITGDGIDDIIWRNATTGQVGQFEMSNSGTASWSVVANVSNDWRLVGTGDLDGDGTDDLLWRHESSGAVGYYAMGSGSPVWQGLGQASFDWDIVGVGDYNGDGTDDILWRNVNTGTVGMYDMDGGPSWQTIGQAALAWDVEGQFVDEFVF